MATKKGSKGTIRGRARASLPDSYKEAPRHAKRGGKTSPDERVEITIRLRRKPGAGEPKARSKPLTRDQFREAYGADPADLERSRTSPKRASSRSSRRAWRNAR